MCIRDSGWIRSSSKAGILAQFILLAILIVRLIHLDSLTNANAFWRTRPISRPQLLLAKSAFLILPALALLAMSTPKSSLETFEVFLPFLAATAAFATVTEKLSETMLFALKMLIIVAFVTMLIGVAAALVTQTLAAFHLLPSQLLRIQSTTFNLNIGISGSTFSLVVNILTFVGYLAVAVFQYLTLQTRLSVRFIFTILLVSTIFSSLAEKMAD